MEMEYFLIDVGEIHVLFERQDEIAICDKGQATAAGFPPISISFRGEATGALLDETYQK